MKKLNISNFDLWELKKNTAGDVYWPTITIIAKWGSGKSWIIKNIMYELKDIPCSIVICPTENVNGFYSWFISKTHIYDKYDSKILDKIFTRQEYLIQKNERRKSQGKSALDYRIVLIMDDCLASGYDWWKDVLIDKIFVKGRHYGITFILSLQYAKWIPPI